MKKHLRTSVAAFSVLALALVGCDDADDGFDTTDDTTEDTLDDEGDDGLDDEGEDDEGEG